MVKISKKTGNRRLLKLAAMLEADAKNKKGIQFDIGVVGKPSYVEDGPIVEFKSMADVKLDCGTTACAMGLAAISCKFKKAGLSAYVRIDDSMICTKWHGRVIDYDVAAKRLFGITLYEAQWLFGPSSYPYDKKRGVKGEREVVRRIKHVVAGKEIPLF